MTSQKELRQQRLAARDQLSPEEIAEKSRAISAHLFELEPFRACRTVMFYAAFRSEVQTLPAMARTLAAGVGLVLPVTLPASHALQPRQVTDLVRDLRPGYCGIAEPDPELTPLVAAATLAAVIVPGSVFDRRGGRLGYGGGFYDRFLAGAAPQALRIGLAFALQVAAESLPLNEYDQRLDYLVTETGVLAFSRRD